jgi:GTPase SAR1 family protein/gas vesicle protein
MVLRNFVSTKDTPRSAGIGRSVAPPGDNQDNHHIALSELNQHRAFAQTLLDKYNFPAEIKTQIGQQLQVIQQKLEQPQLHLAVIGEFSSGKSTLINAFLEDDLLPTSALVATAAVAQIRHGAQLYVKAGIKTTSPTAWQNQPALAKTLNLLKLQADRPEVDIAEQRYLVRQVTTDETIIQHLTSVTIAHPAGFLQSNIIILDTPGTNATQVHHGEITRQVVEQEADAAIILIPATAPLSQSLKAFLDESLRPYLHRCIFVITRMDQVKPQEQDDLLADIRSRLRNQLQIQSPQVYPCAAQLVIDQMQGLPIQPSQQHWLAAFGQLKQTLLDRLQREWRLSIAEHLNRLLAEVFTALTAQLTLEWSDYEQRQARLQSELIPDLPEFIEDQTTIGEVQLSKAYRKAQRSFTKALARQQEAACDECRELIFDAGDREALRQTQTQISDLIEGYGSDLQEVLSDASEHLSEATTEAQTQIDQNFSEVYQRLQDIDATIDTPDLELDAVLTLDDSDFSTVMNAVIAEMDGATGEAALGGAAVGAVIGSMIAPGIGTVIGGALGSWFSYSVANSTLDEFQQKQWQQLRPELENFFAQGERQIEQLLQQYQYALQSQLEDYLEDYRSAYEQTVDTLMAEQYAAQQALRTRSAQLHDDITTIEQSQQALAEQQTRLLAMSVN